VFGVINNQGYDRIWYGVNTDQRERVKKCGFPWLVLSLANNMIIPGTDNTEQRGTIIDFETSTCVI
jgi:hypothetical protein